MDCRVSELYHDLLKKYGCQNWWPAETDYEVVVGALLTQNTNWKNVEKAIVNLKNAGAMNPGSILAMDNETLEKIIRPSGFYRQKAERLKLLTEKYLGIKDAGMTETTLREELLSVKGVGKETADSIILYAFNKPIFVIDKYTRNFCATHSLFFGKEYDEYRAFFETNLPRDVEVYKEYHALIVEWAKREREKRKSKAST